jgi:hypothetical protein
VAQSDDEKLIKKGLSFIWYADVRVIGAAVELWAITSTGLPPGLLRLLKGYTFSVEGNKYYGIMTKDQSSYLKKSNGSIHVFALAVADVVLRLHDAAICGLNCLDKGLTATRVKPVSGVKAAVKAMAGITPPPLGACRYDTNQCRDGVSQTVCQTGLGGSWDPAVPCVGKP